MIRELGAISRDLVRQATGPFMFRVSLPIPHFSNLPMMDFLFKPWIRSYTYSYTPLCLWTPGRGFNGCRGTQQLETWELLVLGILSLFVAFAGAFIIGLWIAATIRKEKARLKQRFPTITDEDCETLARSYPTERRASLASDNDVKEALAWTRVYETFFAARAHPRPEDVDLLIAHLRPGKIQEIRNSRDYDCALKACKELAYRQAMFI
jgi:hypothetical protein